MLALEENWKGLFMTANLLFLLSFSPEKSTSSLFSSYIPGAWTYSRLSHRVELDQVSSPGVYGMQLYLDF